VIITYRYSLNDAKGDPVAHAEVMRRGGVLWLTNVWVGAEQRGQGKATALLTTAVGEWQGEPIYLSVEPYTDEPLDAERLSAFYATFGFRPTDVPGVMFRDARPWMGRAKEAA
jgi:predicted GNAT family N-acyltransferase